MSQRLDGTLARDLRALLPTEGKRTQRLPAAPSKSAIGSSRGRVFAQKSSSGASGGGIASPLTEANAANRTYYTGEYWQSTDGLILFAAPSKIIFTDANGATVELRPDNPPA